MRKIEILHVRNSDDACDVLLFVDGKQMVQANNGDVSWVYVSVDPGAGHSVEEWDASAAWEADPTQGYTGAFAAAVADAYKVGRDSQYVVGDK